VLERWTRGSKPDVIEVPAHGCSVADVTPVGPGVAAYGYCGETGHETPFVSAFDGSAWVEVAMPPITAIARSYARNGDGEWLILGARPGHEDDLLLRRKPGADWQPVTLGSSAFAAPPVGRDIASPVYYEDPKHIEPRTVQTVDGETWVTGRTGRVDGDVGEAAVVLRTRPVAHVLHDP
jgi:hypothetical protein